VVGGSAPEDSDDDVQDRQPTDEPPRGGGEHVTLAVGEDEDSDDDSHGKLDANLRMVDRSIVGLGQTDKQDSCHQLSDDAVHHGAVDHSRGRLDLHEKPAQQAGESNEVQDDESVLEKLHGVTVGRQVSRRSDAHRASSLRFESCSLRSTLDTCVSIVLIDRKSSDAASRYV